MRRRMARPLLPLAALLSLLVLAVGARAAATATSRGPDVRPEEARTGIARDDGVRADATRTDATRADAARASKSGLNETGVPSAGAVAQLPWSFIAHRTAGSWAEYASLVGGHPVAPYLRLLVVGDGRDGDRTGTWVEVWISQRPGSATQAFRLLLSNDPATPGRVLRAKARLLGGRDQEIPVDEWSDTKRSDPIAPGAVRPSPSGEPAPETTSLLTPAGSFRARLSTVGKSKVWISKDVPVLGLVRMEVPGGVGLELHALGADGRAIFEDDG